MTPKESPTAMSTNKPSNKPPHGPSRSLAPQFGGPGDGGLRPGAQCADSADGAEVGGAAGAER